MNKLLIIILGCVFVGGLVFAGYSLSTDSESKDKADNTQSESESKDETDDTKPEDAKDSEVSKDEDKEESFFGSMQDLMVRGKSAKCTFDLLDETSKNRGKGIIYTANDKIRSELEMKDDNEKDMNVYTIMDGDWIYIWNDIMPGGTKMNIKISDLKNEDDTAGDSEMAKEMMKEMNYKCRPWIVDNSKFTPPSDIEFRDTTTMMQGLKDTTTDGSFDLDEIIEGSEEDAEKVKKMRCDMCEIAPTPEIRDKCRTEAGCE